MEGVAQDKPRANPGANPVPSPSKEDKGPVSLSFPSILRNPGLTGHYARLAEPTRFLSAPAQPKNVLRRNDNEGKRWVRRRENARFTDNPHIAAPSKRDLEPSLPPRTPLQPLPARHAQGAPPLRRADQALVRGIEDELTRWLRGVEVEVVRDPDAQPPGCQFPGRALAGREDVREVERTPLRLVWWIEDDTWARYVVHCCARYHNVVSFSKDTPTHRLTHILRPNATRPDPAARAALATPPTTDGDLSSLSSYDSDVLSSLSDVPSIDDTSDPRAPAHPRRLHESVPLSDIASDVDADIETGSALGGDGGWAGDGDGHGHGDLEQAIGAMSLASDDEAPLPAPPLARGAAYRTRATVWDPHHRGRSGSSPSRSPARRKPRRPLGRATAKNAGDAAGGRRESFYDFLFG
ncbi:hypothetical protein BC826DRAFT_986029 [Russula brevipes]|nr:hypothetical protein BC826DRAFT_986029 [Russula brevipes]